MDSETGWTGELCPKGKKSLSRRPLQELEVGPRSRPFLLVCIMTRRGIYYEIDEVDEATWVRIDPVDPVENSVVAALGNTHGNCKN